MCDILEGCHSYPNIIQSSVQLPREQPSTTQPSRKQINQPTKELSRKDSIKRPPVVPRKPPLKRSRVSQEWKDFEGYSSEEDSEQYESGQYENSEQYESEDSEQYVSENSEIELTIHRRGKGRPGFYHS